MGVLNVTPDSFSDGGLFLDHPAALEHGRWLISDLENTEDTTSPWYAGENTWHPPEWLRIPNGSIWWDVTCKYLVR